MITLPKLIWNPSPNFERGRNKDVRLIVIHDEEGTYEGSTNVFLHSQRPHRVSSHFAIKADGTEAMQYVDVADTAWHVANYNDVAVGIEMPGFEKIGFSTVEWQTMANVCGFLLDYFDLTFTWAKNGVGQGFCRHFDLGREGGGHTDPTEDLSIWGKFEQLVLATQASDFPQTWDGLHDSSP